MSSFLNFNGNQGTTYKSLGTGGGTSFTLDVPASTNSVLLTVGGVLQEPATDYTVSGTTVTTTSSVTSGVEVQAWVIHKPGTAPTIQDNSVTVGKLDASGTASSSTFLRGDMAWAGGGKVLQVVSTTKTDTFSTTSDSFVDVTGLTVSITPAATSSKVLVIASVVWTNVGGTGHHFFGRLMRDSTALHVGASPGSRVAASFGGNTVNTGSTETSSINYLDAPSSTSALAYHIEARTQTSGNAVMVNRSQNDSDSLPYSRTASTVTAMEIGA